MNAADLLASLHNEGLTLTADGPNIRIEPRSALTDGLRAMIRERKQELLAVLSEKPRTATRDEAEKLTRLVGRVAQAHGFVPAERDEALTHALSDPGPALTCFKHLAATID